MLRSSKCLRISLGVLLVAVVVCAPVAFGQSASNISYTLHVPITNQQYFNQCTSPALPNGEAVTMNGEMLYDYHFSMDGDGMHLHWSSTTNLTGVGSISGAKYVGKDNQQYNLRTEDFAQDWTTSEKTKLIAQGPTPNMMLTQRLHFKTDKNGNATVSKDGEPVIKCR